MRHIAVKTTKRLIGGLIVAGVFLVVPTVFNFFNHAILETYYETKDIETILHVKSLIAESMCSGDTKQKLHSVRTVGSDQGFSAQVTRELFQKVGSAWAKVYEEGGVFVTVEPEMQTIRVQEYAKPLPDGEYYWQVKVDKLFLPVGVVRTDVPLIRSNTFKVEPCVADHSALTPEEIYVSLAR